MEKGVKSKKLIIFGVESYARIVYEYFTYDSVYEVVAFTVDRHFLPEMDNAEERPILYERPIIPFEELHNHFLPEEHYVYVAVVYKDMNRLRANICQRAKDAGYELASYISSAAFVWGNVQIGEHCFIMEDNTIQPFVTIGNNCILWSGNHVGHHSSIGDNNFISSHAVVSGHCDIGANCFLGVNCTLSNNTVLGKESWVMPGAYISGVIPPNAMVKSDRSEAVPLDEEKLSKALSRASEKAKL